MHHQPEPLPGEHAGDGVDPNDTHPRMPDSIPPDAFFNKLTETQRLEHLNESLYKASLIRREIKLQGGIREKPVKSNYRALLAMIETPVKASSGSTTAAVGKVGSLLNAVRSGAALHDADSGGGNDGDNGGEREGGVHPHSVVLERSDIVAFQGLKKDAFGRDQARIVGRAAAAQFGDQVPKDVAARAAQSMTTISRQLTLEQNEKQVAQGRSLRESMKHAAAQAKKKTLRSSSYPRAIYSVGAYEDYKQKYEEERLEVRRLKKACDGLEPRDQELKLQVEIDKLQQQVINQLALIKGLREKLKILRDQSGSVGLGAAAGGGGAAVGGVPAVMSFALQQQQQGGGGKGVTATGQPQPQPQLGNGSLLSDTTPPLDSLQSQPSGTTPLLRAQTSQTFALPPPSNDSLASAGAATAAALDSQASFTLSTSASLQRLGSTLRALSTSPHGPRGDSCVVLIMDIESSKYLWETFPDTMKTQTEIYRRIVKADCQRWRGYEALAKDDKFLLAFFTAYDACQFALHLQTNLLQAEWSSALAETPEAGAEHVPGSATQFLWRGLRVKIGIDIGAQAVIDPLFPGRISYEGLPIETADYIHKLALGGEILVSHSVAEGLAEYMERMGNPLVEDWGTVQYHPSRVGLRRITPRSLEARLATFNRHLSTAERQLREEQEESSSTEADHAPSSKRLTMVTVLCPVMPIVKANVSDAAYRDTMQRAFHCITSLCRAEGGYVTQLNLNALGCVVAFDEPFSALKFAVDLQQTFLVQDWNKEILRVPQCAPIIIRDKTIYRGLRAHIGVYQLSHAPQMYREPMENKVLYRSKDSKVSTLIAAAAGDGEILTIDALTSLVMERYDELGNPVLSYVASIPTPVSDTLLRLHQIVTEDLRERSAFINREGRLPDEDPDLVNADVITSLKKQIGMLQRKLDEKNTWIKMLHDHLDQKTDAIGQIKRFVLKTPFSKVNVSTAVAEISAGYEFLSENVLVAFSFANPEGLLDTDAALMPEAIETYNAFLDRVIKAFDGRDVRRLASRIARIVVFPDCFRAAACWSQVLGTSWEEEWHPRLDDSTHAALFMASELYPGIAPDVVIWKGLRPTSAMHSATSTIRFNTLTRAHEIIGDDVNILAEMLRCSSAGDCLVSPRFVQQYREKLERTTDLQFSEYGPFTRMVDHSVRIRAKALQQSFPPQAVPPLPQVRRVTAFVAHVVMQDSYPDLPIEFPLDVLVYNDCVMRTLAKYSGKLMSSLESEYVAVFEDVDEGARFVVHLHDELLQCRWTREIQRLMDFRELIRDDVCILRGIRAKIGCHVIQDLNEVLDLFSGRDQWFHPQLAVPFVLASQVAHCGETIATEAARAVLHQAFAAKKVNYFMEICGTVKHDAAPRDESIYQVFPVQLRGRIAWYIDEDKRFNDVTEMALRSKAVRAFRKRREAIAQQLNDDIRFYDTCERNTNPFDDPVHRKTHKLFKRIRPQLDEERSRFHTCQESLALIEKVSMMAEDHLLLGDPDNGVPYYAHMMLHELEHGRVCKDIFFKKDLGAELLGNVLLSDAPQTIEVAVPQQQQPPPQDAASGLAPLLPPLSSSTSPSPSNALGGSFRASFAQRPPSEGQVPQRKTVFQTNLSSVSFAPEEVVQLHIDVERFFQLIKLHGVDNPTGFALDFMQHAYAVAFPGRDPGELDDNIRWAKIMNNVAVVGMDVASVDFFKCRCSMLAYLAQAYQEITQFEW